MSEKYDYSKIEIRPAKREDMTAVANLIQELADFENMPDGPKISATDLQKDGFDSPLPAFRCIIAAMESNVETQEIVGYALYFPTYSTWEGSAMMLEDLYVKQTHRRRGIGERLFDAVAKEAALIKCARLDFHVLEWNKARSFYDRKGAVNLTESEQWCYYRLSGEALHAAAKSTSMKA